MSIAGKVYSKMLRTFQPGFRKGKNCLKQIHILRRLLEAYHQHQLPLLATFEDFSKAFDSFDRKALFEILSHYGIPCKITDAITAMYTNSSSRVRLGNHLSKTFYITTGGNIMATYKTVLRINKGKTKVMYMNYHREGAPSKALEDLEVVEDFKYLGARLASSLLDFHQ